MSIAELAPSALCAFERVIASARGAIDPDLYALVRARIASSKAA